MDSRVFVKVECGLGECISGWYSLRDDQVCDWGL